LDVADVKRRLNRTAERPGSGPTAYSVTSDVTADGRINAIDLAAVRQRLNTRLPGGSAGPAITQSAPAHASATRELFGAAAIVE
jgi:hypothetical protein